MPVRREQLCKVALEKNDLEIKASVESTKAIRQYHLVNGLPLVLALVSLVQRTVCPAILENPTFIKFHLCFKHNSTIGSLQSASKSGWTAAIGPSRSFAQS